MVYRAAIKMIFLAVTVFFTLAISSVCSMFEAIVLGTNGLEIMALKKISQNRGVILENLIADIDKTTSSILTANTIANTFGATLSGVLFATHVSPLLGSDFHSRYTFPAFLTLTILVFSEILPKNIGILYRPALLPYMVYPLYWIRIAMWPVSTFMSKLISFLTSGATRVSASEDEIKLLAEKGAKDGLISMQEKELIANTLSLDDTLISEIMTPRTVILALEESQTVGEVFEKRSKISFGRLPVYRKSIDNIVGVVRRRDLLLA